MAAFDDDDFEMFFEDGDHEDALDQASYDLEDTLKKHLPTDNRDCSCGEAGAFRRSLGHDILKNEHIRDVVFMTVILSFERNRTDVIRIDPGDDDPLAPGPRAGEDTLAWQTSYPSVAPIVTAKRGGIAFKPPGF